MRTSALLCSLALVACGGGDGGPPQGNPPPPNNPAPLDARTVTLSWDANRESGVNRPGGGYEVVVVSDGDPLAKESTKDVPYVGGPAAPTSTTLQLSPGRYRVGLRAYAALDPQGGSNRNSVSAFSIMVDVQ